MPRKTLDTSTVLQVFRLEIIKMAKHLTLNERLEIKALLENDVPIHNIAQRMGRSDRTIYYEIERGSVNGVYSPQRAEKRKRMLLSQKGAKPKLALNRELAIRISHYINEEKLTISQILERINQLPNGTPIKSVNTLYAAIDNGLIPNVTRDSLRISETNIFSKGLLQVPLWIREEFELNDGDKVKLDIQDGKLVIEKK